jgi:hypothetical protein
VGSVLRLGTKPSGSVDKPLGASASSLPQTEPCLRPGKGPPLLSQRRPLARPAEQMARVSRLAVGSGLVGAQHAIFSKP